MVPISVVFSAVLYLNLLNLQRFQTAIKDTKSVKSEDEADVEATSDAPIAEDSDTEYKPAKQKAVRRYGKHQQCFQRNIAGPIHIEQLHLGL